MKKLLLKIAVIFPLLLSLGQISLAVTADDLMIPSKEAEDAGEYEELGYVENLPDITAEQAIASVIKTILGVSMLITLVAIAAVGFYYLTSQGEEEGLTKAKDILLYLIIGMAIIAAAYGIVAGISQFNFFAVETT